MVEGRNEKWEVRREKEQSRLKKNIFFAKRSQFVGADADVAIREVVAMFVACIAPLRVSLKTLMEGIGVEVARVNLGDGKIADRQSPIAEGEIKKGVFAKRSQIFEGRFWLYGSFYQRITWMVMGEMGVLETVQNEADLRGKGARFEEIYDLFRK